MNLVSFQLEKVSFLSFAVELFFDAPQVVNQLFLGHFVGRHPVQHGRGLGLILPLLLPRLKFLPILRDFSQQNIYYNYSRKPNLNFNSSITPQVVNWKRFLISLLSSLFPLLRHFRKSESEEKWILEIFFRNNSNNLECFGSSHRIWYRQNLRVI